MHASTAEAIASGLPVIITDVAENKKWVEDEVNGFAPLKGYVSKVPEQYDDIKDFVLKFQRKTFMKRIKDVLFH